MFKTLQIALFIMFVGISQITLAADRAFYLDSEAGNDANNGSISKPFKSMNRLSQIALRAGDAVYLRGGQTFEGTITIKGSGTREKNILVTSYGAGTAEIYSGNGTAVIVRASKFVAIKNIVLLGNGRKTGNTGNGIWISESTNVTVDSIAVSGFQKSGVFIDSASQISIMNVNAFNNGFAGIHVLGKGSRTDCRDIYIAQCRAENNPGDPTVLNNHSGNGILVGNCTNVLIEYCTATNNGWDMPRKGNGPVGIWAYEADQVVIQHCLSYKNKTSAGSTDGGGFDFDGGVTNSTIQYCLSYGNQGAGFGLFQFVGASPWYNNTIRYNISENDGMVSSAKAGVYVWNGLRDTTQVKDCYFYNNVIYNEDGASISYAPEFEHTHFNFYNNIFVGRNQLIIGRYSGSVFKGNNWWSITKGFNIKELKKLEDWRTRTGQELLNNEPVGSNINPEFPFPGQATITSHTQLKTFFNYQLPAESVLSIGGIDLQSNFGIDIGALDFNNQAAKANGVGAAFGE